jgi:hypothetical protein
LGLCLCRISLLSGLLLVSLSLAAVGHAQTAEQLSQVRKLYVESFGQSRSAADVRSRLIDRLRRSPGIEIVPQLSEAEASVKGTVQIWTSGRSLLSPRSHSASQSTFEGFLSVELIGKNSHTLWSYLVTPSKFSWSNMADDLAKQVVTRLHSDIEEEGRQRRASVSDTTTNVRAVLQGAGATFPAPLYQKWFQSFEQGHPEVQIGYDAVGSGEGIRRLKSGEIDFAASEMPLSDDQGFLQVPTVLGAVVPIYNVPHLREDLNFTPEILAGIYLGKIKKWNDPQIRTVNPSAALPEADVIVVHRSDR